MSQSGAQGTTHESALRFAADIELGIDIRDDDGVILMGESTFDWDASTPGEEDPTGRATFGIFDGEQTQIYLREIF